MKPTALGKFKIISYFIILRNQVVRSNGVDIKVNNNATYRVNSVVSYSWNSKNRQAVLAARCAQSVHQMTNGLTNAVVRNRIFFHVVLKFGRGEH